MKKILIGITLALGILALTACPQHDSDVVSKNLSTAADQFEINRRIVFYNGITGEYMLEIEGFCALGNNDPPKELTVVCKTGPNEYKKSFLGLSDNVTYFVEQIDAAGVSAYHYRVVFKPSVIIPNFQN